MVETSTQRDHFQSSNSDIHVTAQFFGLGALWIFLPPDQCEAERIIFIFSMLVVVSQGLAMLSPPTPNQTFSRVLHSQNLDTCF